MEQSEVSDKLDLDETFARTKELIAEHEYSFANLIALFVVRN
jgi:hypothetical protein